MVTVEEEDSGKTVIASMNRRCGKNRHNLKSSVAPRNRVKFPLFLSDSEREGARQRTVLKGF